MTDPSQIAGIWRGVYYYKGRQAHFPQASFSATFSPDGDGGRFTGTVVDDGPLGRAGVLGVDDGQLVRFTKTYVAPPPGARTRPIHYEGRFSEQGTFLSGTWTIEAVLFGLFPVRQQGLWEAHREQAGDLVSERSVIWPPPPRKE